MISSVLPNDSKMASCWFFAPPREKQRLLGMSDLLTSRFIVEFGQIRKLIRNFHFCCFFLDNRAAVWFIVAPVHQRRECRLKRCDFYFCWRSVQNYINPPAGYGVHRFLRSQLLCELVDLKECWGSLFRGRLRIFEPSKGIQPSQGNKKFLSKIL